MSEYKFQTTVTMVIETTVHANSIVEAVARAKRSEVSSDDSTLAESWVVKKIKPGESLVHVEIDGRPGDLLEFGQADSIWQGDVARDLSRTYGELMDGAVGLEAMLSKRH